jgi:hypothetical protein
MNSDFDNEGQRALLKSTGKLVEDQSDVALKSGILTRIRILESRGFRVMYECDYDGPVLSITKQVSV